MLLLNFVTLIAYCIIMPIVVSDCTSSQRLAGAELIPYSYNLVSPGAAATSFQQVPFAPDCIVLMLVWLWALSYALLSEQCNSHSQISKRVAGWNPCSS
jgi:hypothetical protein